MLTEKLIVNRMMDRNNYCSKFNDKAMDSCGTLHFLGLWACLRVTSGTILAARFYRTTCGTLSLPNLIRCWKNLSLSKATNSSCVAGVMNCWHLHFDGTGHEFTVDTFIYRDVVLVSNKMNGNMLLKVDNAYLLLRHCRRTVLVSRLSFSRVPSGQ